MSADLATRLDCLLNGINKLEAKVKAVEESEKITVSRVKIALHQKQIYAATLRKVPTDYYEWSLAERAQLLGCDKAHLCKTIMFKNTMCEHENTSDIYDSKYICVVVQYCEKIAGDRLRDFIHKLPPPGQRLSKKKINFQLAEEEISLKLSGYIHNAVTPLGMLAEMPVIICESCTHLNPPFVWLGGGAVDVKLGITVADLAAATGAIVTNISDPRDPAESYAADE
ncbi:unnamed protein product [Ectocarpus fasciculatus]